jgi:uncharacterized protein YeaO (DUF488 family)
MKIFTSYYAKIPKLQEADIIIISISLGNPRWTNILYKMKELAPTGENLKIGRAGDTQTYTKNFKEMLSLLNKDDIKTRLKEISQENDGMDVALCCYETPKSFCHRYLVAEWLEGEFIEEFDNEDSKSIREFQRKFW